MKLSTNFTLEEMISSSTADKYGIDNRPTVEEHRNIQKLVSEILQPIRDEYKKPIVISSGFRCERLNYKVGGVKDSQHLTGAAADIHSKSDTLKDNKELYDLIVKMIKDGKISTRQVIWEYGKKNVGPDWIHISTQDSKHSVKKNQFVFIGV